MPGSSSNGDNNVIRPYVRVKIFGHPMEYEDIDQKYHTKIIPGTRTKDDWSFVCSNGKNSWVCYLKESNTYPYIDRSTGRD